MIIENGKNEMVENPGLGVISSHKWIKKLNSDSSIDWNW